MGLHSHSQFAIVIFSHESSFDTCYATSFQDIMQKLTIFIHNLLKYDE